VQGFETTHYREYGYKDSSKPYESAYLLQELAAFCGKLEPGTRVLDVGCGNGHMAGFFLSRSCQVVGIELSRQGVQLARLTYPNARFEELPADQNILERLGEEPFDIVVSAEVIEHLYAPRDFARGCFAALKPGGQFLCTTPYHGYLKNILICVLNQFDNHFNPLWDGGHIKFWSLKTLSCLLIEAGFCNIRFRGAGRLPFLWKSMVLAAEKLSNNALNAG